MALWFERAGPYKLGVLLLFLGSGLFLIGFVTPFWVDIKSGSSHEYFGLWMACFDSYYHRTCHSVTSNVVGWFKATQAMECLGLIAVAVSCLYAIVVNFCRSSATHSRFLEGMAAVGGLCGFVGCMVFVGKMTEGLNSAHRYLGWSFALSLTGSLLVLITAGIVYNWNRPDAPPAPGLAVLHPPLPMQGVPVQGGNTVVVGQNGQVTAPQSGPCYVMPPQGATYPYPPAYAASSPPQPAFDLPGVGGQAYK